MRYGNNMEILFEAGKCEDNIMCEMFTKPYWLNIKSSDLYKFEQKRDTQLAQRELTEIMNKIKDNNECIDGFEVDRNLITVDIHGAYTKREFIL